jgi:hypothetical protein
VPSAVAASAADLPGPPAAGRSRSRSSTVCPAGTVTWYQNAHRSRQLRPGHPAADLSRKQIKRRPVLGGLINEYERAA